MAGRQIDGLSLGLIGAGGLLAYAGVKGISVPAEVQALIAGKSPAGAAKANQIAGTPASSALGTPGVPATGSAQQNLLYVAQTLVASGYTPAAAAGIAGCVDGESGGNPEAQGSGGRGLIGWTPPGTLPDSAFTGNVQADLQAQTQALIAYNNAQGSGLISMLNAQPDYKSAGRFYSQYFERPASLFSDVRDPTAASIYAQLTGG